LLLVRTFAAWTAVGISEEFGGEGGDLRERGLDHHPGVGRRRRGCDRLDGLARIGIEEISYKKGHKYLLVVVDHDTRRLVWAASGRTSATVRQFFDLLGRERCAQITHVSADGADFIDTVVAQT